MIIVWIAKITIVISDVIASSIVLNLILKGSFLILVLYLTTLLFKETDNKKYIITVNFVITLSLLFLGSLVIDFTSSYIVRFFC